MKILSREKLYLLEGLIEITRIKQKELHEIERMALEVTQEKDKNGQPDFGNLTADLLDENLSIDEALTKLGFEIEKTRRFPKKKFSKKEEIIPKKIVIPEHEDLLEDIMSREG